MRNASGGRFCVGVLIAGDISQSSSMRREQRGHTLLSDKAETLHQPQSLPLFHGRSSPYLERVTAVSSFSHTASPLHKHSTYLMSALSAFPATSSALDLS